MAGYWRRPDASAAVLRDGRLHTGDLGYLDEAGFLHIVGRLKPLILVGGYNVYPGQVEAAIRTHPAVAEASVHGMPDARFGERVEALVRLRPGMRLTLEELRAHLADRLAPFEMPRRVRFTCEPEVEAGVAPSAARPKRAAPDPPAARRGCFRSLRRQGISPDDEPSHRGFPALAVHAGEPGPARQGPPGRPARPGDRRAARGDAASTARTSRT